VKLTAIRNALTSKVGKKLLRAQKHAPTILFAAGIVGVVATAVLASRATLKLEDVLDEHEDMMDQIKGASDTRYSEQDRKQDLIVAYIRTSTKVTKLYAPAVIVGLASIAALTGSHVVLNRRNVALTAAYAAVDKAFRQYRERVVTEYGYDKDQELRYGFEEREIVEETKQGPKTTMVKKVSINSASMYAKWFDEGNPNWEPSAGRNMMFLRMQQQFANDKLHMNGYLFLNDVYEMLGLKRTSEGQAVGWVLDGGTSDNFVDFGFEGKQNAEGVRDFINGWNKALLLDFNVDGVMWDKI
jgi:hypothetical protein